MKLVKTKPKLTYTPNTFYCEDCFKTIERMAKNNVKCKVVITSPPYNTGKVGTSETARKNFDGKYDIYLDTKTSEEYINWTLDLFNNLDDVLEENGVIAYNMSYGSNVTSGDPDTVNLVWLTIAEVIKNTPFMIADRIIWKKGSALPNNVSPNKLTRIVEDVFIFVRKTEYKTYYCNKPLKSKSEVGQQFYGVLYNFIEAPNNDGSCPLNKATFSSTLVDTLLNYYAPPKSIVYDPFMGSGTTAVSCKKNGHTFIGSEISEGQCDYAENRTSKVTVPILKRRILRRNT